MNLRTVMDTIRAAWSAEWFVRNLNDVRINLAGRVLSVDSGVLIGNVGAVSRMERDGFTIGTNVDYGVYWEGDPRTQRAAPGAFGGAGTGAVPARSFIRVALEANTDAMSRDLARKYQVGVGVGVPNVRVDFTVDLG